MGCRQGRTRSAQRNQAKRRVTTADRQRSSNTVACRALYSPTFLSVIPVATLGVVTCRQAPWRLRCDRSPAPRDQGARRGHPLLEGRPRLARPLRSRRACSTGATFGSGSGEPRARQAAALRLKHIPSANRRTPSVGVLMLGARNGRCKEGERRWEAILTPFPRTRDRWWVPASETVMRAHKAGLVRSHSIQHWVPDFGQRSAWRSTAPGGLRLED